jgi:alanine dehydrogenase
LAGRINSAGFGFATSTKDIVAGQVPPERQSGATTLFKSHGLGLEDVAAAAWVYEKAVKEGCGTEIPLLYS